MSIIEISKDCFQKPHRMDVQTEGEFAFVICCATSETDNCACVRLSSVL